MFPWASSSKFSVAQDIKREKNTPARTKEKVVKYENVRGVRGAKYPPLHGEFIEKFSTFHLAHEPHLNYCIQTKVLPQGRQAFHTVLRRIRDFDLVKGCFLRDTRRQSWIHPYRIRQQQKTCNKHESTVEPVQQRHDGMFRHYDIKPEVSSHISRARIVKQRTMTDRLGHSLNRIANTLMQRSSIPIVHIRTIHFTVSRQPQPVPGFRSRCTIRWKWQYSTPEMTCWKIDLASSGLRRPSDTMWSKSSPPGTYSCARKEKILIFVQPFNGTTLQNSQHSAAHNDSHMK